MASSSQSNRFRIYFAVSIVVALIGFFMVLYMKNMNQFLGVVLFFIPVLFGIIMDIKGHRSTV